MQWDESSHKMWQTFYWDQTTGRLDRHYTQQNTATPSVSDDTYTYTNSGQLIEDSNFTQTAGTDTQCFLYDGLQDLTQAWTPTTTTCGTSAPTGSSTFGGPAPYWTSYTVDPNSGNRLTTTTRTISGGAVTATNTATYHYPANGSTPGSTGVGAGGPNAVSSITPTTGATQNFTYDKDGSTTALPGRTIGYDGQERPTTQTVGSTTESDIYDASGTLLLTSDPTSGTTAFVGDTQLHAAAGSSVVTASRTYAAAGLTLGERDTSTGGTATVYFLDTNAQGTASALVAQATGAVTRRYLDPFGNPRGPAVTWASNHAYLNAPQDPLAGSGSDPITRLGARQYDAILGRFLSVDPLLATNDPQSLNGYAYTNNSPTTETDGTGTRPACEDIGTCEAHMTGSGATTVTHVNTDKNCANDGGCGSSPGRTPKYPTTVKGIMNYYATLCFGDYNCEHSAESNVCALLRGGPSNFCNRDPNELAQAIFRTLYADTGSNPKWLGTLLGEISALAGGAAIVVSFIPGADAAAPVLEGVSIVTGTVGTALDCADEQNAVCGLDLVATTLSYAGAGLEAAAHTAEISEKISSRALGMATSVTRAAKLSDTGLTPLALLGKVFDIYSVGFGASATAVSSLTYSDESH